MKKVSVVAYIKAKPGQEAALKPLLMELLAPTRAEAGCLNYDLHQAKDNPSLFLFYENWESLDHLMKHSESAHLKRFREQAGDLLAAPIEITLWEMIA